MSTLSTHRPRTLLANLVNNVMIEAPPDAYARVMAAVTPRKLWLAEPGDCVVTLAPCRSEFREYVAGVVGVPTGTVDIVAPDTPTREDACALVARLDATHQVAARPVLTPFVLDEAVVGLAGLTGVRIDGYHSTPDAETLTAIRYVNTKAGFRAIAAELGLPVAPGGVAYTLADLGRRLERFLATHQAAIVKVNRSSNGHGTFVVTADQRASLTQTLRRHAADPPYRQCGWVYEEYLPFLAEPSVELLVDDDGVHDFYACEQRTVNNGWTGMVTPVGFDPDTAAATALPALLDAGRRVGNWLRERGYRGYFDVDCGLTADDYVVTEANVRRTGGTYLEQLARRLHPHDRPVHWRADARPGTTSYDFAGAIRAIDKAGLAGRDSGARGLLLVDTLTVDGKWRYLVVGPDATSVAELESELADLLELT